MAAEELHPLSSLAPAQPAILIRLLDLLAGEARLPAGCAEVLGQDPSLALWVMSTTACPGPAHPLPTLAEALAGIGLPALKTHLMQEALELLIRRQHASERVQAWRQSLRCAHLCESLARELAHPQPHEAYLAGLLHNLGPLPPVGWDLDQLLQERDAAMAERIEAWKCPSLLADALRYQHWPMEAMRDAAGLVQMLWAARTLVEHSGRTSEAEVAELLGMPPERLAALIPQAYGQADEVLDQSIGGAKSITTLQEQPIQLWKSLSRFASLEQFAAALREASGTEAGPATLASHLTQVCGLSCPVYFRYDAPSARLISQALPGHPPTPALSTRVEGSDTAAAMAFLWQRPILAITVNQGGGASLLDTQLARLAQREGVLAIPVGNESLRGVLVACGYRAQLADLAEDSSYLAKLGRLAAPPDQGEASMPQTGAAEQRAPWPNRARQLAHEINNPLGIIKNYLALLRVKLGEEGGISDELRIIHEELDRIARIVNSLVTERPEAAELELVDVNELLSDLIKVAAPGLTQQKQVRVETSLEEALPRLRCNRDRLKQLLLNLLLNAIEATSEQGTVSLETHRLINHRLERQLEILVSNTGPDIAPEVLARLFEPVQSTKGEGHAGLGLSIVRSLATDLNATIACRSQPGRTTFQVLLPLDTGKDI